VAELDAGTLHAWARAWRRGHDAEHAAELAEALGGQMAGLAALWDIDVSEHELIPTPPAWSRDDG
jgi:hypothetical protein